jgi:hypothetical protein
MTRCDTKSSNSQNFGLLGDRSGDLIMLPAKTAAQPEL